MSKLYLLVAVMVLSVTPFTQPVPRHGEFGMGHVTAMTRQCKKPPCF